MKQSNIDRLTVSTYAIVVPLFDYKWTREGFLYAPCEARWGEDLWLVLKWNENSQTFKPHKQYEDKHEAYNAAMELHNQTLEKNEGKKANGGIINSPMKEPFSEDAEA